MTLMSEHAPQQWHLMKTTDPQHMRSYRRAEPHVYTSIYPVICAFVSKRFMTKPINCTFSFLMEAVFFSL